MPAHRVSDVHPIRVIQPRTATLIGVSVVRPERASGPILRERLLAELASSPAPVVLVTGRAGAGKTTLVRQWAAQAGSTPVAWATLDWRDNDSRRLWATVTAALGSALPGLGWAFAAAQPEEGPDEAAHPEAVPTGADLDALTVALAAAGPLRLVLDDVHFVVAEPAVAELERLLGTLPAAVQVAVVSRTRPPLQLARRAAHGEVLEIDGSRLLLTADEAGELLRRSDAAWTDADVEAVLSLTGGWPVAVALSARVGPVAAGTTRPLRRHVADYLTEEVLATQPPDVRRFLLDTSILDQVTVAAANAVRDAADSARLVRDCQRRDLLAFRPGGDVDAWTCHAIVRDYLLETLEADEPQRWQELHRRAAGWFSGRDRTSAVAHALAAEDPELAGDLVVASLADATSVDQVAELRLLRALPDTLLARRPALRAHAVVVGSVVGDRADVRRWLALRPTDAEGTVDDVLAECWQASEAGDLPRLVELSRTGLARSTRDSPWWLQFNANLAMVACAYWDAGMLMGPLGEITSWAGEWADEYRSGMESLMVAVPFALELLGQSAAAEHARTTAAGWLAEQEATGYRSNGTSAWADARWALEHGDVETAARWRSFPDDSAFTGRSWMAARYRLDQARVRYAAGDVEEARAALARVQSDVARMADPGPLAGSVVEVAAALGLGDEQAASGRSSGSGGAPAGRPGSRRMVRLPDGGVHEPLSEREVEVLRLMRSEFSMPEIASHLYVSYNTVKTHTKAVYRKLDANTRSGAVARGRELGYL